MEYTNNHYYTTHLAIGFKNCHVARAKTKDEKNRDKIKKLSQYVGNNRDRIVDYSKREKDGLIFTSNLAESTVESLINQRYKGQQHMRWSREGLNPVLQLRASIHSNDWSNKWRTAVLNAA